MSALARSLVVEANALPARRPSYDPKNLHPLDAEARQFDDPCDDIVDCDWDEIIASTQDDYLAGRFAFNSADYPTQEEAMIALDKFLDDILDEVLRETAAVHTLDARRS